MATEANQTQIDAAVLAQRASSLSTGDRPSRESRHANNSQEVQRYSDHLWHSKQTSSPSLLFYRKLSCDSSEGTIWNEEYDCLDCSSKGLNANEELNGELSTGMNIDRIIKAATPIPGKSSEGSPCQLESSGEGVDAGRNRTGSSRGSCTTSSLCMSPDMYSCHSPTSSSSPGHSPVHSPGLSFGLCRLKRRHIRRSSLPVSMLAFHKVIKEDVITKLYAFRCNTNAAFWVICALKCRI